MADKVLTNKCTFSCPRLQGFIQITQKPNNVKDISGAVLTKDAKLSGVGICSTLTTAANGVPTLCTLKMSKYWIAGFDIKKKIKGISILNEKAKMPCPVGSVIKVKKPLPPIVTEIVLPTVGAGGVSVGGLSSGLSSATSSKSDKLNNKSEKPTKNNANSVEKNENISKPNKSDKADNNTANLNSKFEKTEKSEISKEKSNPEKSGICSYSSCEKASECPYMKASDTIKTDGIAAKLRKNSPQKEMNYNESSDRKMEKYKISWNNQAHHMISAGAAYNKYPELVKLGNYFNYDINCQENCYFLPCWESDDNYGKKESHFKKAQAYQVMNASGLQWHVGQHSYRVNISEDIKEKYPELKTFICYNDKINEQLKAFLSECNDRFDGICIEENYEAHKAWFINKMNSISETIEEYLDLFGGNPKDSFPYFVSAEALRFAYEIPRSGKVILAYKTETKWYLKRYKFTNTVTEPDIQINLLDSRELAIADQREEKTIRNIILFCENVSCFLIADETQSFRLPFEYKVNYQYISDAEKANKESHFSAMLAVQAENDENEYEAPKAVVVKRLKECGLK